MHHMQGITERFSTRHAQPGTTTPTSLYRMPEFHTQLIAANKYVAPLMVSISNYLREDGVTSILPRRVIIPESRTCQRYSHDRGPDTNVEFPQASKTTAAPKLWRTRRLSWFHFREGAVRVIRFHCRGPRAVLLTTTRMAPVSLEKPKIINRRAKHSQVVPKILHVDPRPNRALVIHESNQRLAVGCTGQFLPRRFRTCPPEMHALSQGKIVSSPGPLTSSFRLA